LHVVPFAATGLEHAPVLGLHVPATLHCPDAVHTTGFAPTQAPATHESACVHAFPSLHEVPFGACGFEHTSVLGLQAPATLHWPDAVQTTGLEPTHAPLSHASSCVHAFPSLHAVPFGAAGLEQAPVLGLHVPATLHCPDAVHVTGFEPVHTPLSHASFCVHAFPSLQTVPFVATGFEHAPVAGLHVPTS
jgi:hypothetical protein